MAKTKIRYRTRAKKTYRRARGFGGGHKDVIDGVMVGVAQGFIPDGALYGLADPLVMLGVGYFRRNAALKTLGGYQLGLKIPALLGQRQGNGLGAPSQV